MRVHIDEGRPDVTRFEINCRQGDGYRPDCRFDRGDQVIVDEDVNKCRAVTIKSCLAPVG
jgi:hypothetical protein